MASASESESETTSSAVSSHDSSSQTRRRKKRKWDQPAECLASAGLAVPGLVPLGALGVVSVPGVIPVSPALLMNPLSATSGNVSPVIPAPLLQQHAAAIVSKLSQPKIQDELIAREIVINDAESSVRYKLTKRQTQEEIQRCTGAVVITRGKYRPPNAPPDAEKPLYLHISAGAHLKDTAERVLAVDSASSMVEEMLKHGQNLLTDTHALSTCVFLGFDADPLLNVAARIHGPNDQYINHIMNETGARVILRGHGSGNAESLCVEGGQQQQLHLFLSSNNPKCLEDAKRLAENLLDTISVECGISRVSSSKVYSPIPPPQQVYSAVPPPQQLLAGVQNSVSNVEASTSSASGLSSSTVAIMPIPPVSSVDSSQRLFSGGTSYSGYGGIYPQATPLQQVALALRQSSSPHSSTTTLTTLAPSMEPKLGVSSTFEKEKRPQQRRKFQELPIGSKGSAKPIQGFKFLKPDEVSADLGVRNVSTMPAPKKLVSASSNGMPSPPSRTMLPPPSPPKFMPSAPTLKGQDKSNIPKKTKSDPVPGHEK
ncbi:hypothetical protein TIFTF001_011337 [Ficus carica]|uniref:Protein RIK n=1 Tax=Ficus carica TaxID=3494 RepID=A0AA87ZTL1_FICCA|nr:hypothetical protein TIFTF001_011337 [Ficus carica]